MHMTRQLQNVVSIISSNYKRYSADMRDEDFFKSLGQRIAALRQQRGLTQAALAHRLGFGQQALATYENATRRLPSSLLIPLSNILGVTLEELLAVEPAKGKPGPAPKLQRQFEAISRLPKSEQRFFSAMIDRFLHEHFKDDAPSSVPLGAN